MTPYFHLQLGCSFARCRPLDAKCLNINVVTFSSHVFSFPLLFCSLFLYRVFYFF
ncbi:hypothetical protein AHF37_07146 [Paragonimus kellicotti]|nr:hypothetical protein AHF37_07146 [Paragonimus kellicotti]